jgi:hypothetical protein
LIGQVITVSLATIKIVEELPHPSTFEKTRTDIGVSD